MAQPLPEYVNGEPDPESSESSSPLGYYWSWAKRATCGNSDVSPELFFDRNTVLQAKLLCRICPVRDQCLDHALTHDEKGYWGGTTDEERRKNYPTKYRRLLKNQAERLGLLLEFPTSRQVSREPEEGQ